MDTAQLTLVRTPFDDRPEGRRVGAIKLWQGCGKNPDFAAEADIINNFLFSGISNLRVCNAGQKTRVTDL